ncbi:MAG: hypothetical protein LBU69_03770, partial [Deltaproteobacteria bacterium]|nr:hypothetical protein [Deltaproteobacteria bacterium]
MRSRASPLHLGIGKQCWQLKKHIPISAVTLGILVMMEDILDYENICHFMLPFSRAFFWNKLTHLWRQNHQTAEPCQ